MHNSNVSAPHVRAHCHRCGKTTGTVFKPMSAGIGNACERCGMFRKGKPYISRNDFNTLTRTDAKGGTDEAKAL